MKRKVLGVIGGVGPLSTAYFMEVVINKTDAEIDQEHIDMIVLNHTEIPDRTDFILGKSALSPVEMMSEDAKKLEKMGADIIVTPCNTAHFFYDALQASVKIPFIDMITETALHLKNQGVKRVGILATNGTIKTKLFQDALALQGIGAIAPSDKNQQYVMDIIYENVKANRPVDLEKFKIIVNELRLLECERVVLGCTELSLLKREYSLNDFYVDSLEILAEKSILACGKKIKHSNP